MSRLDAAPEILDLATELGVGGAAPVDAILGYCRRCIDGWVAEAGGVAAIDGLESLVTQRLQMVFEEVRDDEDFARLTEVYARGKKEFVFAGMRSRFDDDDNLTYGALIQRRHAGPGEPDRFVAVIDCRGNKLARRFFTRWHEIAHRLTTHGDLLEPVYRSEHDPIERMMDEIAAQIGFYEPIFIPAFRRASEGKPHLTFNTVETIINDAFPTASFQATLFACARHLTTPVVYLEAALAHKKEVKRRLQTPSMFGDDPPPGELRAVKVIPNKAALQDGFTIPTNMRVPADSLIHRLFDAERADGDGQEDLSQWESQGKPLEGRAVVVEGRKVADRVIAIVQPVEARRGQFSGTQKRPITVVLSGMMKAILRRTRQADRSKGRNRPRQRRSLRTGPDSAVVEPIVLRPGDLTRMVFKPQIVNNKQDENKPVKGHVLWQKRGKSEVDEEWADEARLKLSHMTAGSGIKLELNTDELYLLTQAVRGLYGVFWKHDKQLPKTGEEFDLAEYAQVAKTLDTLDCAAQLIEAAGQDGFVSLMKWIVSQQNSRKVIENLSKLDLADLAQINALAGIGMLKQALATWAMNEGNPDEAFWQATLTKYSFVFSQVFSTPVVVFGSKVYVGGKSAGGIWRQGAGLPAEE